MNLTHSSGHRSEIELQERDLRLLRGLFESRIMTLSHAAVLYFEGRHEAAKKRVQKLKAVGLLAERPRRAYEPSVLFLTHKAFVLLGDEGVLLEYPRMEWTNLEKRARVSDLTVRHELQVMDVKAAFVAAARQAEHLSVAEFCTWPMLCQFRASPAPGAAPVLVKPDGLIRITERDPNDGFVEHTFFLEVDRSTEPQGVLAQRAACYLDYYQRGGLAAKHGRPRGEYKLFPFRILMVFRNAERRNNTAERLLSNNPPILTLAWLTTFEELRAGPWGPIWARPLDYRDALKGGAQSEGAWQSDGGYRRSVEREASVARLLHKQRLLGAADETPPARGTPPA